MAACTAQAGIELNGLKGAALLLLAPLAHASPALAQRADENAVTSAEDAFGTSVGHEQIGLYDEGNVRGFSPGSAGNFRMEGLYFDVQGSLGSRIVDNEVIHVGPSAQGYAFPSPTGIVDLSLRPTGKNTVVSALASTDTFGTAGLEIDAALPLRGRDLGIATGVSLEKLGYANGGGARRWSFGAVPRWRPMKGVELTAFYNRQHLSDETWQGLYVPTGEFLPPRPIRDRYPGPGFTRTDSTSEAFGVLGRAIFGEWTLRGGLFRSRFGQGTGYANLIFVNPDATTERQAYAYPASGAASWSGELRLSRRFREGPRQHLVTVALRGRDVQSNYGGGDLADLGPAGLNEVIDVPPPPFAFGPEISDHTRQLTGGLSYSLAWKGLGEVTIALQRTRYRKAVTTPGLSPERGSSTASLPSISANGELADGLTVYGSYMRGLEDAGTAPGFAANGNAVLPAIRTRQVDAGIRWKPLPGATLILGYFRISKPYIDLDTANVYGVLGTETHEGIETSLAGKVGKNLRIVVGGIFQHPRVTASPTIAEPVGPKPVNQPDVRIRLNANWTLPFAPAFMIDAYMNHDSSAVGTVDNAVVAPGSTRIGAGFRYKFNLAGQPFTARFELYNITNTFEFAPTGSGVYVYNTKRNAALYLAADF